MPRLMALATFLALAACAPAGPGPQNQIYPTGSGTNPDL